MRRVKKGSAIYEYLQATGVLEHGSAEAITSAKNLYWAGIRKQWKADHRNQHKHYTVSFSDTENILLQNIAEKLNLSITTFIKNTCIATLKETPNIDKKTVGMIRKLLLNFYAEVQPLLSSQLNNKFFLRTVLNKITELEKNIVALLHTTPTTSF